MTRAPVDYREFVKIAVDLPDHPKLGLIDDPAAGWAHVVAICYCRQHRTDGSFPLATLLRRAGVKRSIAARLFEVEMWHDTGHSCDRCPQPIPGMAVVHDYLRHQQSADEISALSEARREAGRKGAASRWHGNGDGKSHSKSHANGHGNGEATAAASGMAEPWQTDGTSMAELEVEEEKNPPTSPPRGAPRKRGTHIPENFGTAHITADMVAWARAECPLVDHRRATEEFVDYWLAIPGQRGTKLDWPRTWKNRLRDLQQRAEERQARRPLRAVSGGNPEIGFWEQ